MMSINELNGILASRYGETGLFAVLTQLKKRYAEVSEQPAGAFFVENVEAWTKYKKRVLNTNKIEKYLQGNVAYGTRFLKILQSYKKEMESKLNVPHDFDEETTVLLVEDLKDILEKRFTGLLTACHRGIHGDKNDFSEKDFLEGLVNLVETYLRQIGFYKIDVKVGDDLKKLMDMFEVIVYKPTDRPELHGKIQEIEVLPYAMKYMNEDNETAVCYMNGRCIVWRAGYENHS